jgi:hypothetical protein
LKTETDFRSFKVASFLPKEIRHPKIGDPVWRAFIRGEFDVAAFQAMKAVEVSMRAAAGLGDNLIGVKLVREAFAPEAGPLTDTSAEGGERVGIGFGEQAIRGEGGNKVTTSIISKHRAFLSIAPLIEK